MAENEARQIPSNSLIDNYTKEVTEGVYTFDKTSKNQSRFDFKKSQSYPILRSIVTMLLLCGFAIGALAGSSIAVLLLDQCKFHFILIFFFKQRIINWLEFDLKYKKKCNRMKLRYRFKIARQQPQQKDSAIQATTRIVQALVCLALYCFARAAFVNVHQTSMWLKNNNHKWKSKW